MAAMFRIGFPHIEADKVIGRYIAGHLSFVTRKSAKDADLEQMEGLDDVWALCLRKPRPGYRLLGRFLNRTCSSAFAYMTAIELVWQKRLYSQSSRNHP